MHAWRGKVIMDPAHEAGLEAAAAVHEFEGKLPREKAEAKAHQEYLAERARDAAAHHLAGVRAAHAAGHEEAARQHGAAYLQAVKAFGGDPFAPPDPGVQTRMAEAGKGVYRFSPHPADALRVPG